MHRCYILSNRATIGHSVSPGHSTDSGSTIYTKINYPLHLVSVDVVMKQVFLFFIGIRLTIYITKNPTRVPIIRTSSPR